MRQTSLFELRQRKRQKTVEHVDLTGDVEEDVEVVAEVAAEMEAENPFLVPLVSLADVSSNLLFAARISLLAETHTSDASNLKMENEGTLWGEGVKVEDEGADSGGDLKLKHEEVASDGGVKVEHFVARGVDDGVEDRVVVKQDEPSGAEEPSGTEDPSGAEQPSADISDDNLLLRFYDSDSDNDNDSDYEFVHENDIDLNYDHADEEQYCFKVTGAVPVTRRDKTVGIDMILGLELMDSDSAACPRCHIYLGSTAGSAQEAHILACMKMPSLEDTLVKKLPSKKAPSLIKLPLYKNRDPKIASPVKAISPPKSLSTASRKKPIPQLKILTFPATPSTTYSVSMDAFNYAPNPDIDIYFLSHFHADHYGGISKKWCFDRLFDCVDDFKDMSLYRPLIYCSEITGKLLTLKYGIDPRFIQVLEFEVKYLVKNFNTTGFDPVQKVESEEHDGLYVTLMTANHCPGSAIFLFESKGHLVEPKKYLHCGDFRVNKAMIQNKHLLKYNSPGSTDKLDKVYLDTTYLTFHYNFPKQEVVCEQTAQMFLDLANDESLQSEWFGLQKQSRITDFLKLNVKKKKKLLILVGTYLIGKERLAISILKKLDECPIFVLNIKSRDNQYEVIRSIKDEYLEEHVTTSDLGDDNCHFVIHLVPMAIVYTLDELTNYFYHNKYFDHFERCIGIRPTGWTHTMEYLTTKELDTFECTSINDCTVMQTNQILNKICDICLEQPPFSYLSHLLPQNKKTRTTRNPERDVLRIYSVPYSEHSSYRELTFFSQFLSIDQIIPTVNTHSSGSVFKMNNHMGFWQKLRSLRHKREMNIDPMIYDKLKNLDIDKF